VVGEGLADRLQDEALGLAVDRRHEVDRRLEGDLLAPPAALAEEGAGAGRGSQCHALEILHAALSHAAADPRKRG
jgi:hypothetical protein